MLFADYELRAHRLTEQDQPITAEILTETYKELLTDYYGDALDLNALTGLTWARIPHFFNSPYYVYQDATCFASAARIAQEIMAGGPSAAAARERSHAAAFRRQRLSDGAAAQGRCRSEPAGHGQGGRRSARQPRHATGTRARTAGDEL